MNPHAGPRRTQARLALLFGLATAAVALLVLLPFSPGSSAVREGDRAPQAYVARRETQYESTILTERLRDEAALKVPDVYFPPDPAVGKGQELRLRAFLDGLRELRQRDLISSQRLTEAAKLPGADRLATVLGSIIDFDRATFDDFDRRAVTNLQELMREPLTAATASQRVRSVVGRNPPEQGSEIVALTEALSVFSAPNVTVDTRATEEARRQARERVEPVLVSYSRGQVIVQGGFRLSGADIEALEHAGVLSPGFGWHKTGGAALLALAVALLLAGGMFWTQPLAAPARLSASLVWGAAASAMVALRIAFPFILPDGGHHYLAFAIPVAAAAMVTSVVAGFGYAALVSIALGALAAFVAATFPNITASRFTGPLDALQLAAVTTAAGLAGAACLSRRHQLLRYGFAAVAVATTTLGMLAAFWLVGETHPAKDLPKIAIAAAIHGAGAAAISAVVLALLARRLGLGASGDLARLASPLHPLLVRLQEEAPGTYHHAMLVATLSEAAARRVGADPVLARVGAAFHDIGKLSRPSYFIENNLNGTVPSPHDALAPEESARLIRAHVADGLALARHYGLPPVVQDFIPQHHGTRLVSYFFRKAEESARVEDLGPYRYDGPRPASREAAIVMLADSSEALVRAHVNRGEGRIDDLIDRLIVERVAEGQLDESGMTVGELRLVAGVFKETLRAVYHARIPYPAIGPDELARIASS